MRQGVNARGKYLQQGERSRGGLPFMIIRSGARMPRGFWRSQGESIVPRRRDSTGYYWGSLKGGVRYRDLRCCAVLPSLAVPCLAVVPTSRLRAGLRGCKDAPVGSRCQISNGRAANEQTCFFGNKKYVRVGRRGAACWRGLAQGEGEKGVTSFPLVSG